MRHPILLGAHFGILLVTSLVAWSEEPGRAPRSTRTGVKVSSPWRGSCACGGDSLESLGAPTGSDRRAVGLELAARIRLAKYARRDESFDGMTGDQWVAMWRASAHCAREMAAHTCAWGGVEGGDVRGRCAALWRRLEAETRRRLRKARVPEDERMARWVRLVLAAAG